MSEAARGLGQRRLLRAVRVLTLLIAGYYAISLGTRYELLSLPEEGCSPVARYSPGTRLLVDRRSPHWEVGDCVFVEDGAGATHLVILAEVNADGLYWTSTDVEGCPGVSASELGWLGENELLGRVVMSLGR